jgi:hypothetical protein
MYGENSCRFFFQKREGKRQFVRPRLKQEDNIKNYLKGTGLDCVNWINLAGDMDEYCEVLDNVMDLNVP